MLSKNSSERVIQKTSEAKGDLIGIKIADKIKKYCYRIIQKKLQMKVTKKCLKKDTYLEKRVRKLLLI